MTFDPKTIKPYANLSGANLSGANLCNANLRNANLCNANLGGANLGGASLYVANLSGASLYVANLYVANLSGADLSGADLSGANLRNANLSNANLSGADLSGASLYGANLSGASLYGAEGLAFQIPQEGSLIVWKKLRNGVLAKLLVQEKAKRTASIVGRKCRAEYVKVLELVSPNPVAENAGLSSYDGVTTYRVGRIVRPDEYNGDPRVECTNGIHFFLTREEAEAYT